MSPRFCILDALFDLADRRFGQCKLPGTIVLDNLGAGSPARSACCGCSENEPAPVLVLLAVKAIVSWNALLNNNDDGQRQQQQTWL